MCGDANTSDIRPGVALIDEFTIHFFTDAALCAKINRQETQKWPILRREQFRSPF